MIDSDLVGRTSAATDTDPASAVRLAQRPSQDLARFIISLRQAPGALGEHVQTFLLGKDPEASARSINARLVRLRQVMGPDGEPVRSGIEQTLNYLLDDIEMLILPRDVQSAFALLVQFIECDGAAAESSRDEDWEVQQAFQRAIALLAQASPQVPRDQRERAAAHLRSENSYGLRVGVREALG